MTLSSADCFQRNSFRNTTTVSNSLDPDQARPSVGPDLGPTVCEVNQQTTLVCNDFIL